MYTADTVWGTDLKKEPQAVKVRLARVYKLPGQSMVEIMNELKTLTEKDFEDFRKWFADAGYPCTTTP
jgi:hypothetical protein